MLRPFPLALVGCGKAKAPSPRPARRLYTSTLFRLSLEHAEAQAARVWIVSALHGLVDPGEEIFPYALALGELEPSVQRAWGQAIAGNLEPGEGRSLLLLAGGAYAAELRHSLAARGWLLEEPLRGLSVCRRLHWLAQQLHRAA